MHTHKHMNWHIEREVWKTYSIVSMRVSFQPCVLNFRCLCSGQFSKIVIQMLVERNVINIKPIKIKVGLQEYLRIFFSNCSNGWDVVKYNCIFIHMFSPCIQIRLNCFCPNTRYHVVIDVFPAVQLYRHR